MARGREKGAMNIEMIGRDERASAADLAIRRIVAEIAAGLRHGYFDFRVTCEVIGQGRRRLVFHAGKTYQFLIPVADCE
jgi:hypothetical protein